MRLSAGPAMMPNMTVAPYLAELDAALDGPRRKRRDLLQEASDHLDDATDAYLRAGYDRAEAERQAVTDFGAIDEVAPAFQTTLAVAASRRTALLLLGVLMIQPFVWDGPLSLHADAPPSRGLAGVLDVGVEYVGGAMIAAAVMLAMATGIGNRWFHAGRRIARLSSYVVIGSTVTIKVMGVSMVLLSSPSALGSWVMVLVFLVVPFSVAAASARRTLALC
jgi:hypothetical protein